MVVIEKLHLNKKADVSIPKPKELFGRVGFSLTGNEQAGTGDQYVKDPDKMSKVEAAREAEKIIVETEKK